MRPVRNYTLPRAADPDGIAASQTPGAAGDLTLNGALVSDGVATIKQTGSDANNRPYSRHGQLVTITSAGDDSGRTFTITGETAEGGIRSEEVAGANAGAATSTNYFATVTQISVDAATAGAVTAGVSVAGAFGVVPLDHYEGYGVALAVIVGGTVTYTVEDTQDAIWSTAWRDQWTWTPGAGNWLDHDSTDFVSATASAKGNYEFVPTATRCKWSSWSDGTIEQQIISARFRS